MTIKEGNWRPLRTGANSLPENHCGPQYTTRGGAVDAPLGLGEPGGLAQE